MRSTRPDQASASAPSIAIPDFHGTRNTPGLQFQTTDPFLKDLRLRVQRYFRMTGQKPRDCPRMYVKTALILMWFAASYVALVFVASTWWQGVLASVCLGLGVAGIGFNVQHDGSHRAYSDRLWVNKLMACSLDLIGGSSYIWARKHNTFHHTYTNIEGQDNDIQVGILGRMSPHQRRLSFHRYQHLYFWALYGLMALKWYVVDDFREFIAKRCGTHPMARPQGRDLTVFVVGKIVAWSLAFVIPALVHPLWLVVPFFVLTLWVSGISMSVVFQLAHVVEEVEFPEREGAERELKSNWALHQLRTTADFARDNRVLAWLLGGLNFQVEHHLFPRVCHVHYPKLSRLVENACRRAGVPYNAHPTMRSSLASHFRFLRRMGTTPATGHP